MVYMPEYRHKWHDDFKSSMCRMHNGHWLGIPAGSHDYCISALHLEKHVQRLSRAGPAAAPVRRFEPPMHTRDRGGDSSWTLDKAEHSARRRRAILAAAMVVYELRVA